MNHTPAQHPSDITLQQLVAGVPLFHDLDVTELDEVVSHVRPRSYRRGDALYGAGDPNPSLMILHSGRVKTYRILESGHERLIRVLNPGEFLGETSFLSGGASDHFAEVLEDAEICTFHHDDIRSYLLRHPSVAFTMLETLSQRLESAERRLGSLAGDDAERRVADYLLGLLQPGSPTRISLPIAKKDVASYLALTPETLSRRLAQFEAKGWIRLHPKRQIDVLDAAALRSL